MDTSPLFRGIFLGYPHMPAKNISQVTRMVWKYYDPIGTTSPGEVIEYVPTLYVQQTGFFGKRSIPLPFSTNYQLCHMRATTARYDKTVIPGPGQGEPRKYVGIPTLRLTSRLDFSHDLSRWNEAVTDLNSTIRNGRWESGVFLAELKQTSRLAVDAVLQISQLLGSIRRFKRVRTTVRKNGRTRKRTEVRYAASLGGTEYVARSIGGIWLLARYGIAPAIYDLQDSLKLLRNSLNAFDGRVTVKSHPKTAFTSRSVAMDPGTVHTTSTTRIWFKAMFRPPSSYEQLMTHFRDQLGLSSVTSIAWELTTLSFVVDWFVDVGGYLEALNKPEGFTIVAVESNAFTRASQTVDPNGSRVDRYGSVVINRGSPSTEDLVFWTRNQIPYPSPRLPSLDPELNPKRVADSLALLVGNYRRALRL